jgi:hypothetical protein
MLITSYLIDSSGLGKATQVSIPYLAFRKQILENTDKKMKVCVITLDLAKAFDTINHQFLLLKI